MLVLNVSFYDTLWDRSRPDGGEIGVDGGDWKPESLEQFDGVGVVEVTVTTGEPF